MKFPLFYTPNGLTFLTFASDLTRLLSFRLQPPGSGLRLPAFELPNPYSAISPSTYPMN